MSASAIEILCAELGIRAYDPNFLATALPPDISDLGRQIEAIIMGVDQSVGPVAYGFVSSGPDWVIATIRGTQMPDGSLVEWLDDLDAFLAPCPLDKGTLWHRGFGKVYSSLTISGKPIGQALRGINSLWVHGHSLGGPLATYCAIEAGIANLGLFASPKPGDSSFAAYARGKIVNIWSFANQNDVVPNLPVTVDEPWKIEDFQPVVEPTILSASLVTPPVPSDWASSHNLANYLSLLKAFT